MTQTEALFRKHLMSVISDPEAWYSLFHQDAVIEFPYAPSVGTRARIVGIDEIKKYRESLPDGFESFKMSDLAIHEHKAHHSLTAEFKGSMAQTNEMPEYAQTYICVFETRDGKISRYKEYWDPKVFNDYLAGKV